MNGYNGDAISDMEWNQAEQDEIDIWEEESGLTQCNTCDNFYDSEVEECCPICGGF